MSYREFKSGWRGSVTAREVAETLGLTVSAVNYAIRTRGIDAEPVRGVRLFNREQQLLVLEALSETCTHPRWRNDQALRRIGRMRPAVCADFESELDSAAEELRPLFRQRAAEIRVEEFVRSIHGELDEEVEALVKYRKFRWRESLDRARNLIEYGDVASRDA